MGRCGQGADRKLIAVGVSAWHFIQIHMGCVGFNKQSERKYIQQVQHFWRLTCQWCHTYQSASGCSFPAISAAPWSDQQVGYPESRDAYSPETLWRGFCTPDCPEQDNLRRGDTQQSVDGLHPRSSNYCSACFHDWRIHKENEDKIR